ncbi:hypothetical protein YC2023_106771 [Brassica napus]
MNWSRSWSKVCDSDRIVPSPSRSASGPWCWTLGTHSNIDLVTGSGRNQVKTREGGAKRR